MSRSFTIGFVLLATAAIGQEPPVGMVTQVQGDVKLVHSAQKAPVPAALADLLRDGTRLMIGKGARAAVVFCPSTQALTVEGPAELQFSTTAVRFQTGKPSMERTVPGCRLPGPAAGGGERRMGGVTLRGGTGMSLHHPVQANVRAGAVRFTWEKKEGATLYRFQLRSEDNQTLTEKETKEPGLSLAEPSLPTGRRYRWSVTALQGTDVLASASGWFRVLEAAEEDRLKEFDRLWPASDDPARALMLAQLCEELNLPAAALAAYQQATRDQSPNDWLKSRIDELNKRLGAESQTAVR